MANKNFVKEVRLKVEFSELSQKYFAKMIFENVSHWRIQFYLKAQTGLTLRAPTLLFFRGRFMYNLHGRLQDFDVSTDVWWLG